jgi:hypothetical protein
MFNPAHTPAAVDCKTFNFGDLSGSLAVILYEELLSIKAFSLDG